MNISNIGHTILHIPSSNLHLNNILHVPSASKNLVSVHKLARDNHAFLKFHPKFFLIKWQETKKVLHQGRSRGGLYPLVAHSSSGGLEKQVHGVSKLSTSRWHSRLGQPAIPLLRGFLIIISFLVLLI